jgi:hypothetical protein
MSTDLFARFAASAGPGDRGNLLFALEEDEEDEDDEKEEEDDDDEEGGKNFAP